MNRERIQILRDHLAQLPDEKFGMEALYLRRDDEGYELLADVVDDDSIPIGELIHTCGTAACIAGYAAILAHPQLPIRDAWSWTNAWSWLDLEYEEAKALFEPEGYENTGAYTRQDAIETLDRLLETGRVEWPS